MNIDDCMKITHKNYKKANDNNKGIRYIKFLITRILLSIIFVISTLILIKIDDKNLELLDKYIFNSSIEFTKINKWYQNKFGKLLPNINANSNLVFSGNNDINKYEKYENGIKIITNKGTPVASRYGGIVVFIGEKEKYGNTIIIQGYDGINYYYGNLTNINVNLYDYIEKDTLLGETIEDYYYLVLEKEGTYIDYEEYIK